MIVFLVLFISSCELCFTRKPLAEAREIESIFITRLYRKTCIPAYVNSRQISALGPL